MRKIDVDLSGIVGLDAVLAIAEVSELVYLKKNARYLKQETYLQLKGNIAVDGGLSSVPLVALNASGKYDILSGNHRVKAAVQTGQKQILVLCIDKILPEEKIISIQLSHNALEGEDDPQILKSLYDELESLDMKLYSGVDTEIFDALEKLKSESMSGDPLRFKAVTIMFLPEEVEKIEEAFDRITDVINTQNAWLVGEKEYDRYLDAMEITKSAFNVKNTALAFNVIMENFEKTFDLINDVALREENGEEEVKRKRKTVPLVPLFGSFFVPAETGRKLQVVLKDAIKSGSIKQEEKYRLLDVLVESYWDLKKSGEMK